jgi:SAM-dependent methyltransferase
MQQDYYKEYYNYERQHWWCVAREKLIINTIKSHILLTSIDKVNLKILNIGCSTGRSSEYLAQFGEVTSLEYDKECCDFTTQKTGLQIINGSITELPFEDKSFDLVCAFDVIEHVEDHEKAFEEMKRVADKNGVLFITVPAFMSLWSHHDEVNFHFRRYKIKEVHDLFCMKRDGVKMYSTYFNSLLFLPILLFRKASNIFKFGDKRKGAGSDFESYNSSFLNKILFNIMHFEKVFIKNKITLPFGVSLLYLWKKNN